jgi:hypothetical protein
VLQDEWPENNHFPPQLYVREARRLVGDRVFNQNDRIDASTLCRNDSIGRFRFQRRSAASWA